MKAQLGEYHVRGPRRKVKQCIEAIEKLGTDEQTMHSLFFWSMHNRVTWDRTPPDPSMEAFKASLFNAS